MSLTLREVVDDHILKMDDFIGTQVKDMKELQRQLSELELQKSSIERTLQENLETGTASKAQLQAFIDALKGDLQSSLEGVKKAATDITINLEKFADDNKTQRQPEAAAEANGSIEGGGKRMKRSRRSNRGRKSMRK